jgi:insertion element IS1 protein InsB
VPLPSLQYLERCRSGLVHSDRFSLSNRCAVSLATFQPLWQIVVGWACFLYITDGDKVYPCVIEDGDHLVSKTAMTRVEGENGRLRHDLARWHRRTLCYSNSVEM